MLTFDSDEPLVRRCRGGDLRAADLLFRRHQNYVYRVCYGMLRGPQDAEDVAQEAFLRAFARLDGFEGRSSFRSWLHRVAVSACLDHLKQRKPTASLDDVPEALERRHFRPNLRLEVAEALECLDPRDRAVLLLREVEGLSYQEVAEALGCSIEAIRSRLHRARRRFRAAWSTAEKASIVQARLVWRTEG